MTFLFEKVVFGPIHSRRLGISLGINLLPTGYKCCTFNCFYCECGWTKTADTSHVSFPPVALVKQNLEEKLFEMKQDDNLPETLSFAGNGEPTMHPDFAEIIDIIIELRNKYSPRSKVAVLSNATMLHLPKVVEALKKIDQNILKLDCGTEETYKLLNEPLTSITLTGIIKNLKQFQSNLIIQTLFVRGEFNGVYVDNTTDAEVTEWLRHIREINPEYVMIYTIARATPAKGLEKVSLSELEAIAEKVMETGVKAEIYY